jgi:hypothetical protein
MPLGHGELDAFLVKPTDGRSGHLNAWVTLHLDRAGLNAGENKNFLYLLEIE